jgi:pentatricopeptide repeat protein
MSGGLNLTTLLRRIENILTTEDVSFKGLATAAGLDPTRDFRGVYLNGVPLADQDLRGFDFSGSDLRNTGIERARRDRSTILELAIFDGPSLDPAVITFNNRLRNLRFSEIETELTRLIEGGQRRFDVISFTTAIKKAPSLVKAAYWYEEMRKAGVAPNEVTFSTLISKAGSEERAAYWYEEMRKAGVAPDDVTGKLLTKKGFSSF